MKKRALGSSGIELPELTLGTWLTFSTSNQELANGLVEAVFDAGINAFDTADVYGMGDGERALAIALSGYPRDSYFLASKVFFPMSDAPEDRGLSKKHIFKSIDNSLSRLNTDYLDLYQCHRFDSDIPLEETIEAMGVLISSGKIRAWGTSVWAPQQLQQAQKVAQALGVPGPVSEQPRYNILCPEPEREVFPVCEALGLGVLTWSPLAQGFLTGKYSEQTSQPKASRASHPKPQGVFLQNALGNPEAFKKVEALKEIARGIGVSLPALAIAWCLRRREVTTVLIGASGIDQLKENLQAVSVDWSEGLERAISKVTAGPLLEL
ncbi:MAG TPA: aldo/keto reductase [Planctomycetes bacterium]|nr:aldo/keto reductase [Planctomycetota bacterium]